jgi:hypothetical protein
MTSHAVTIVIQEKTHHTWNAYQKTTSLFFAIIVCDQRSALVPTMFIS